MDGHEPYYRLSAEDTLRRLRSAKKGLAAAEAADRRKVVGENRLEVTPVKPVWRQLLSQIVNPIVLLLLVGIILALWAGDGNLAAALAVVAAVNAALELAARRNAGSASTSLANLLPARTTVLRDGKPKRIETYKLVPGDVITLKAGDTVPADARLISADELYTDEIVFFSSAQPVYKFERALAADTSLARRHNMLYAGTTVTQGSGTAVVTATGMSTELGQIINLCTTGKPGQATPKSEQILNNTLALIALAAGTLAALLCAVAGLQPAGLLLFAVAAIVAAVPTGLPLIRSLLWVRAVRALARGGIHVKKLAALEALGSTTAILAHTAALTGGELTARELTIGRTTYRATGSGYGLNGIVTDATGKPLPGMALKDLHLFFQSVALASTATLAASETDLTQWQTAGAPTEGALLALARKAGINPAALKERLTETIHFGFGPDHRCQTSVRSVDGQLYAFMQGSLESVLAASNELWDHGHVRRLTAKDRSFYEEKEQAFAEATAQTVACAYRVLPPGFDPRKAGRPDTEQNMVFLGLIGLEEPLREQALEALKECRSASLPVSLLADETPAAALLLARRIGLPTKKWSAVVSGEELSAMGEKQIASLLRGGDIIFNQLDAAAKTRLVAAAKANRHAVTMIGMGADDLPALERADVSITLGSHLPGADLILPHGSFGALVTALQQARCTVETAARATSQALADSAAILAIIFISVFAAALFALPTALTAIQILLIALLVQLFPQVLGQDSQPNTRLNKTVPQPFSLKTLHVKLPEFIGFGLLAGALTYGNYLFFFARHHVSPVDLGPRVLPHLQATTLACVTLAFCLFVHLLMTRRPSLPHTLRQIDLRPRVAYLISLFVLLNVVYNPGLHGFLGTAPLTVHDWLTALGTAGLYTLAHLFYQHTRQHSRKALLAKHDTATVHAHVRKRLHKKPA